MSCDAMVRELRELRMLREELDVEIERIEDNLKETMREQEVDELRGADWKITYHKVSTSRIDVKRLKSELPDVAEEYTLTSVGRRFCVT